MSGRVRWLLRVAEAVSWSLLLVAVFAALVDLLGRAGS